MSLYNIVNPASLVAGQPEDVSQVLANFQAIQAVLNGGIDDANVRSTAAISPSKLAGYPSDVRRLLRGDGSWSSKPPTRTIVAVSGSGTYTTPAGCTAILVECTGSGGAGGGCPVSAAGTGTAGASASGGGYAASLIANPAASYAYVVGGGGVPVLGAAGGDGNDTTFGAVVVAKGGGGGSVGPAAAATGGIPNTPPVNTGFTGQIFIPGGGGQPGYWTNALPWSVCGAAGAGGGPYGGPGGTGAYSAGAQPGSNGNRYGGGGAGGKSLGTATAATGGSGSGGFLVVTEFYD